MCAAAVEAPGANSFLEGEENALLDEVPSLKARRGADYCKWAERRVFRRQMRHILRGCDRGAQDELGL